MVSSRTVLTEPKLLNGFHSNLYFLKEQFKDSKLQTNFETASSSYVMTAMNVIIHNGSNAMKRLGSVFVSHYVIGPSQAC